MIDYHKELVSALSTILPTHYEMALTSKTATPCISYQERNNVMEETGNTRGYSRISYTVKVWGRDLEQLQTYAKAIDNLLRPIGWNRVSVGELYDNQSSMIQKIMTYECLALEKF